MLLCCVAVALSACTAPAAPAQPTPRPAATSTARPATSTPTTSPTATATAQPSPAPTGTPSPAADAPLLIWAVADETARDPLKALLESTAQAAGVPATVIVKSADALVADLEAGAAAELQAPDLVWGSHDDLFLLQRSGLIQPANDSLADDEFLPATLQGAQVEGARWGTPVAASGGLLQLYNRKLVPGPVQTTDELIQAARAKKRGGQAGLVAAWVEARWLEAWLRGFGGSSFAPDGSPTLNTPQMIGALNLLKELRTAGPPAPSTYLEGARLFRRGEAAFAVDGDWAFPRYRSVTETLDLGFAPLPRVPATGLPALAPLTTWYVMYGANLAGSRLIQAHTLGTALTTPDSQRRIAGELHFLPSRKALLSDAVVAGDPALAAEASGAENAPGIPPIVGVRCYWNAAEIVLPALLLDEIVVDKAAERLQERTQNCINAG